MITLMLFLTYQVSSALLGHLHFSLHFFLSFMEQLFNDHPILYLIFRHVFHRDPRVVFGGGEHRVGERAQPNGLPHSPYFDHFLGLAKLLLENFSVRNAKAF